MLGTVPPKEGDVKMWLQHTFKIIFKQFLAKFMEGRNYTFNVTGSLKY